MDNLTNRETGRHLKTTQRTCDILSALEELGTAGVTELAEYLNLSKGSVHGHVTTLYRNEYVAREGDKYRLSLRFVSFGEAVKKSVPIYELAKEETDKLANETGETVNYVAEEHGLGVYLYKSLGSNGVNTAADVGNRKHLHCTAVGKAILAYLPEEQVEQIINHRGLPSKTSNTITNRSDLHDELNQIRKDGVAFDQEEIVRGLRCVAAPILGQNDEMYGSISVAGPTIRMKGTRFNEEIPEKVLNTTNVIQIVSKRINDAS